MDLVEYCKHAVVIEEPPEGFILVFHRLIGTRGSYGTDKPIQTLPKYSGECRAEAVDDLA
ncbi:hypothetical protein D3C81_790670 [compost metagenome]